jgi:hypothetical protein
MLPSVIALVVLQGADCFITWSGVHRPQLAHAADKLGKSITVPIVEFNSSFVSPHLGDIMNPLSTFTQLDGSFSELERMVLTANANLQRLMRYVLRNHKQQCPVHSRPAFSAYYNEPVHVEVLKNECILHGVYNRQVDLTVRSRVFCKATSVVALRSQTAFDVRPKRC